MKTALGIFAGSLVSGMYLLPSSKPIWWVIAITYVLIVAYVRS